MLVKFVIVNIEVSCHGRNISTGTAIKIFTITTFTKYRETAGMVLPSNVMNT